MCVCDTQVGAGQRISTEYVTAVVSSGTGHSGIVAGVLTITVDSAAVVSRAGDNNGQTGMSTSAHQVSLTATWKCDGNLHCKSALQYSLSCVFQAHPLWLKRNMRCVHCIEH